MEEFFHGLPVFGNVIIFLLGAALINTGSKILVDSAVSISKKTGIPQMTIGATILGLATSLPEFMISILATIMGSNQIAMGNVIGSCACNIGLVCGISVIILPVTLRKGIMEKNLFMLSAGAILMVFALIGILPRWGGGVLLICAVIYSIRSAGLAREESKASRASQQTESHGLKNDILKSILGMVYLSASSVVLVLSGKEIALWLGVPELIIALTMIAFATSLPELVTALRAAIGGHMELGIGTVVGSNVLNIFWILGTCALIKPLEFEEQTQRLDAPFMLVLMLVLVVSTALWKRLGRVHGIAMLVIYGLYITLMMLGI